jgi:hypothetical protein
MTQRIRVLQFYRAFGDRNLDQALAMLAPNGLELSGGKDFRVATRVLMPFSASPG